METSENIRQVVAYVSPEDYKLLHYLINITGAKQSPWLVGRYLLLGLKLDLAKYGETVLGPDGKRMTIESLPSEIQDGLALELIALRHRNAEQLQATLNALATKTLNEEDLDRIQKLADSLDLSLEEANKHAESPFASVVLYTRSSTAKGRCIQWLAGVFTENTEVPVQTILEMADKLGYSTTVAKQAKRALGLGHCKREGDGTWCWTSPTMEVKSTVHPSSSITLDRAHLNSSVHEHDHA